MSGDVSAEIAGRYRLPDEVLESNRGRAPRFPRRPGGDSCQHVVGDGSYREHCRPLIALLLRFRRFNSRSDRRRKVARPRHALYRDQVGSGEQQLAFFDQYVLQSQLGSGQLPSKVGESRDELDCQRSHLFPIRLSVGHVLR
jgi:hypothetical protein